MPPTEKQMRMICALVNKKGMPDATLREILMDCFMAKSRKELTMGEANLLIDILLAWQTPGQQTLNIVINEEDYHDLEIF